MGLIPPAIEGFKTYWEISVDRAKQKTTKSRNISLRFWFYPLLSFIGVKEDVVVIRGFKIGVFTEVLSAEIEGEKIENLSTFRDEAGDEFAEQISRRFEELSKAHPSFSRLQGLAELVGLTTAIEEMEEKPDLDWWLKEYKVKKIETPRKIKVLKRRESYRRKISGDYYESSLEISGGMGLVGVSFPLKAGDVTPFKEAVLKSRPAPDTLSWTFVVEKGITPSIIRSPEMKDLISLLTHAISLQYQKRYEDAINLYSKVIELKPDWSAWPYTARGFVYYAAKGDYDRAISDYTKAIEINPRHASAYYNRGCTYYNKGLIPQMCQDFKKACELGLCKGDWARRKGLCP
jgi:tetratricopeptide (TPR) repeat protein